MGDKVYLRVKRFQQHFFSNNPTTKLNPKYHGPFPIVSKVWKIAYKLQLPDGVLIHPIFHVSLLKKSIESTDNTSLDIPSPSEGVIVEVKSIAVLEKWGFTETPCL